MTPLETALCNLKDEIMASSYFHKFYEYAELIERGQEKFPQVHIGKGQYKQIFDFDVNGTGYIRKTGATSVAIVTAESLRVTACNDTNPLVDITIPLRLVAVVPKVKLSDNSFSDDLLGFELIGYINKRQPAITDIVSVHGKVTSVISDRDVIWSQEVKGRDKQIDLALSVVAVDFQLIMRANLDCININCDYQ